MNRRDLFKGTMGAAAVAAIPGISLAEPIPAPHVPADEVPPGTMFQWGMGGESGGLYYKCEDGSVVQLTDSGVVETGPLGQGDV